MKQVLIKETVERIRANEVYCLVLFDLGPSLCRLDCISWLISQLRYEWLDVRMQLFNDLS